MGDKARITLSKVGVRRDPTNTDPSSISLKENIGHSVMIFMHVLYSTQVYVYPHFQYILSTKKPHSTNKVGICLRSGTILLGPTTSTGHLRVRKLL